MHHPDDERLIRALDRELALAELDDVRRHLAGCPACRKRADALAVAGAAFERAYRGGPAAAGSPIDFARVRLKARLAEEEGPEKRSAWSPLSGRSWATALLVVLVAVLCVRFASVSIHPRDSRQGFATASGPLVPDARLTPGAVRSLNATELCAAGGPAENRPPRPLQQAVFHEYGIDGAAPDGYEVDHLITPALGGSDDIRNLWPESYSSEWNAHVKDELEDYLHSQVCTGKIDLSTAQREIATNWIAAYQRYFHTDQPLHRNSAVISKRDTGFGG